MLVVFFCRWKSVLSILQLRFGQLSPWPNITGCSGQLLQDIFPKCAVSII
jgi:hypothetical protein